MKNRYEGRFISCVGHLEQPEQVALQVIQQLEMEWADKVNAITAVLINISAEDLFPLDRYDQAINVFKSYFKKDVRLSSGTSVDHECLFIDERLTLSLVVCTDRPETLPSDPIPMSPAEQKLEQMILDHRRTRMSR